MARYAIGDVQGCFGALEALLARIAFDGTRDELWFVGDLVNRGPQSLAVLRFVKSLGDRAVCVLGNHDLHLLAVAVGAARLKPRDTLHDILAAPDRKELIDWLRTCPLLHVDAASATAMVHAGLLPNWDMEQALSLAREVETCLRSPDGTELLYHMYGNNPDHWEPTLRGWERLRVIVNGFTRLRYCDAEGRLDLHQKGKPGTQPAHLLPWFQAPSRNSRHTRVIFGHWSTLGAGQFDNVVSLDSGCVWGGALTAVRLDDGKLFSVPCEAMLQPN